MLGLLLIYFIWQYFSELAFEYNKNKWLYFVIGVVSYYAGTFVAGIIIGLVALIMNSNFVETTPEILINLMALPIGLLAVRLVYWLLKRSWSEQGNDPTVIDGEIN